MPSLAELLILVALNCPIPQVVNSSNEPWEAWDNHELQLAIKGCKREYPEAPCLRKFDKRAYHTYWATCCEANN